MPKKQKKNFKKRPSNQEYKKRFCKFTALGIQEIDYKDINLLKEYISPESSTAFKIAIAGIMVTKIAANNF